MANMRQIFFPLITDILPAVLFGGKTAERQEHLRATKVLTMYFGVYFVIEGEMGRADE
ncbi:MAG: hypothetical protein OEY64_11495 [Nitrospinota bacterium]|nr:hypothetical protein [Nitrospinota bacterium]